MTILELDIPRYAQEAGNYCGPACAKTCRNGYPDPPNNSVEYQQAALWNKIQNYNSGPAEDWHTDPDGLEGCLQNLTNPGGVNWIEVRLLNPDDVLTEVLRRMNNRNFPAPVLVKKGTHWVVVVGWETEGEGEPTVDTLKRLRIFNPRPVGEGSTTWITKKKWYAGMWKSAVTIPGTWRNHYVAIVEGP